MNRACILMCCAATAVACAAAAPAAAEEKTDFTLLEPRDAVASADSGTQVTVTWKPPVTADRVAGYEVYLGGEQVAGTKELSHTQKNLKPGVTYVFRVAARNAAGDVGRPSRIAEATTPAEGGSVLPLTSIGIFERGRDLLLTWWTGDATTSKVLYGPTAQLGQVKQDDAKVTVHVVRLTGLPPEADCFLKLASADGQGNTGESMVVRVRTGSSPHSILTRLEPQKRGRLVLPEDFEYRGAFRPPAQAAGDASRWGYGGAALTYCPKGDPKGEADGCPGSLFGVGHPWKKLVSEISIPAPVISEGHKLADLPVARTLQPFADITSGLRDEYKFDDVGGLAYLEKQSGQDGDRIYWSFYIYYAVQGLGQIDHPAFGSSSLDLARPDAQGLWHVGPYGSSDFHPKKTANYMFDIPRDWADKHTGGLYLATGKGDGCGSAGVSHGPALFAFGPYKDGTPPAPKAALTAKMMILYPSSGHWFPYWSPGDAWTGGSWLTAGGRSAVLICGRRALGEPYYGVGRAGDWGGSKGYHTTPYEVQFLLYDPADLAEVLAGTRQPHDVLPYAVFRPGQYLWGGAGTIGAAAFDRDRSLLYLFEPLSERPIIHVFAIKSSAVRSDERAAQ